VKLEFHTEALAELQGAALYYESRQAGLGVRFLDVIDEALDRIARDPIAWTPADEDVRRCLTRVFPFALYYTIEPEFILIMAVAHLAREPGYWASRR
jgi:toxin ParE1/3/4